MSSIAKSYGYTDVPTTFTRKQLLRVLKMHDADVQEFDAEHVLAESYKANTVLSWLGY